MSGDTFKDIGPGATIINRSKLQNAMNTVAGTGNPDVAEALKEVAEAINSSGNSAAAENFDAFTEELQRSQPRKSLLKSLWNGVVEALPTIVNLAAATAKIVALFA